MLQTRILEVNIKFFLKNKMHFHWKNKMSFLVIQNKKFTSRWFKLMVFSILCEYFFKLSLRQKCIILQCCPRDIKRPLQVYLLISVLTSERENASKLEEKKVEGVTIFNKSNYYKLYCVWDTSPKQAAQRNQSNITVCHVWKSSLLTYILQQRLFFFFFP